MITFLERECPHLWALLNQHARRELPGGIAEFLSGPNAPNGQEHLTLADKRVARLTEMTSEQVVGDTYRSRLSGVATENQLAELLCEIVLVDALGAISSSPPNLQPKGIKGRCDVQIILDGTVLYGEVKRLADSWEGGERSIFKSEEHNHSLRPRAMDLHSKIKDVHRQFPEGALNILFLFHPSWASTELYIQLALFGDASVRSLHEMASASQSRVQPALHNDGLYALPEWRNISACVRTRVNPDCALRIGRFWRNPKANVILPTFVEKKLALAR